MIRQSMSTTINLNQEDWKIRRDSYNVMIAADNKLKATNYGTTRYAEYCSDVQTFLDAKKIYIEYQNEYLKKQGYSQPLVDIDC